jgi:hypothetical protein
MQHQSQIQEQAILSPQLTFGDQNSSLEDTKSYQAEKKGAKRVSRASKRNQNLSSAQEKRSRVVKNKEQIGVLHAAFMKAETHSFDTAELSGKTGLSQRVISKWRWEQLRKLRVEMEQKDTSRSSADLVQSRRDQEKMRYQKQES